MIFTTWCNSNIASTQNHNDNIQMTEEANIITFYDYKIKISQLPSHQPVALRVRSFHLLQLKK